MKRLSTLFAALLLCFQAFAQLENCTEILDIKIVMTEGSYFLDTPKGRVGMVAFGGSADSKYFKGEILPGGFDNQKEGMLSARYALKGTDFAGQECMIFIENSALSGSDFSSPKVYTDSKALAFVHDADLIGLLDHPNGEFHIRIFVKDLRNE